MNIHFNASEKSCALDSVLVSLFFPKNLLIERILHRILMTPESELSPIDKWVRNIYQWKNINELRKILPPHVDDFSTPGEKDAGEFLSFFLSLFPKECFCEKKLFQTIADSGIVLSSRIDYESSPIQYLPSIGFTNQPENFLLTNLEKIQTSNVFSQTELYRGKYKKITVNEKLIDPSIAIFSLNRFENGVLNDKKIIYPQTFNHLQLKSIVCFQPHHYTAYVKDKDGKWFYYDDLLHEKILRTGEQLDNPNPETHGVIFFYF